MSTREQVYLLQLEEFYRALYRTEAPGANSPEGGSEASGAVVPPPPSRPLALAGHYDDRIVPLTPKPEDIANPHLMLHDVYANTALFKPQEEDAEERSVPHVFTKNNGELVAMRHEIVDEQTYMSKWTDFTKGMLAGLDWTYLFAAGGSVLGCLLSETTSSFEDSDIDLFLHGVADGDDDKANDVLKHLVDVIVKNTGATGAARMTTSAVTIFAPFPYRNVQLVLSMNRSPAEVLLNFDVDCCSIGFDGTKVWALERARRALTKSYNYYTLVPADNVPKRYERRLFKYSKRGFVLAVPHLDRSKIDADVFQKNLNHLEGMELLVRYDELASRPHVHFVTNWSHSMDEALSGGRLRCKVCKKILTDEDMTDHLKDIVRRYGVGREMNWIKDKAVLQDYENNKFMRWQRSFGNYTPTVNSDWAHGAYKDKDDVLDVEELLQDVDEKSGEEEEEEEEVDKQPDGAQPRMDDENVLALALSFVADVYRAKLIDGPTRSAVKSILFGRAEDVATQKALLFEGLQELMQDGTEPPVDVLAALFSSVVKL